MTREINQGNNSTYIEHADVINNLSFSEVKPPKHIGDLPSKTETFLGRDKDLEAIHKRLNDENNLLLLVNGTGGIGKTTLASHYYHKYKHEYEHLIWTIANPNINDAFNRIALSLKLDLDPQLNSDQRTTEIIKKLLELESPCLLVIDNANNLDDLKNSYNLLRKCSTIHLLLTTRITNFQQVNKYKIGSLEKNKALELFNHFYIVKDLEKELLEAILVAVDYNTLVIELLAKNLKELNSLKIVYTIDNLKEDLLSKGVLKLSKTTKVSTDYQDIYEAKPEEIVEAMYNLSDLSEEERKLLSIFSVLPAKDIPLEHLEDLLIDFEDLTQVLILLSKKGWIDKKEIVAEDNNKTTHFRISPVTQEIVRKQNNNKLTKHISNLIDRFNNRLEYQATTGSLENMDYIQGTVYISYSESLHLNSEINTMNLALLTERIGNFYESYGELNKALFFFKRFVDISQNVCKTKDVSIIDQNNLGIAYAKLANTHLLKGDIETSYLFYKKSYEIDDQLLKKHPQISMLKASFARSHEKLADLYKLKGDYLNAIKYYEKRKLLTEELYNNDSLNIEYIDSLAIAYSKLGDIFSEMGKNKKALSYYNSSIEVRIHYNKYQQHTPDSIHNLALIYLKKGYTLYLLETYNEALSYCNKSKALFESLHNKDKEHNGFMNNLSISYSYIANIYNAQEKPKLAIEYLLKQLNLLLELCATKPDQTYFLNNLSLTYERMGETYIKLDNIELAIKYLELNLELSEQLYNRSPNNLNFIKGLIQAYTNLGEINLDTEKYNSAICNFKESLRINTSLYKQDTSHIKHASRQAHINISLHRAYTKIHTFDKASEHLKSSINMYKTIAEHHPKNVMAAENYLFTLLRQAIFYKDILNLKDEANQILLIITSLLDKLLNKFPNHNNFLELAREIGSKELYFDEKDR